MVLTAIALVPFALADYPDVFVTSVRGRVNDLSVVAQQAQTRRDVGVGDGLAGARRAYPQLQCGTALEGSEYATYPVCTARLGPRRYIWFGEDPIDTIAMDVGPFDD